MTNTVIAAILTSSTVGMVIAKLFDYFEKKSSINEDFQLLLLSALKTQARDALADGYITMDDLESLERTYTRYKEREGNGYADTLMGKVRALPIKENE